MSDELIDPVLDVKRVPLDKVKSNEYNPNSVASEEMRLLHLSIKEDGYTQPIVVIEDEENDCFVIVDGFHRYAVMRHYDDIREPRDGLLPVVVIDKDVNDRMASTIRHNRARGKHSVDGMADVVFRMLDNGWSEEDICDQLGMEPDELIRLKHISGFSKLFEDAEYKKAWKSKRQLELEKEAKEEEGD